MNMNIDDKLDSLRQIKEVDAPPFLFTRISQRINNLGNAVAPVKWKWVFVLTSIVIVALNVSIYFKFSTATEKKTLGIENIISSMNLSTPTDLYNE
jgi:hypothetical protein